MRNTSTIPVLRFPEFNEEWKEYRLSEFLTRYSETNKDEEFSIDEILSLSSHYGIVSRKELLEDTYSNVNHLSYKKTRLNDFVYGKSISASYPFGLFKVNDYKDGLLSTLYYTFKVKENVLPKFLDCYFSHLSRANNFLRKYVLVGDRYITADANYLLSGKIYLPTQKEEQKKIADFLIQIDQRITQLKEKKENLERYKKGVAQKIFSQKIRFKDDNGNEFPNWEMTKFENIFKRVSTKNKENNQNVLTISAQHGLINQQEYFNKSVSANDVTGYYLVKKGDFAYNKSYSKGYPMGAIKRLTKYEKGVVSTLYICFNIKDNSISEFYEHYFESGKINKQIHKIAQEGARNHGLLNMSVVEFFKDIDILKPSIKEQQIISSFLNEISNQIQLVSEQLEETVKFKKALLQKMFCV
ncbi:MAG: restriction endonuclease subunit S [Ignavibacteriales bacterium]|nr:restriction endonuclease subunit S [Ignavibacteriales bacterium]